MAVAMTNATATSVHPHASVKKMIRFEERGNAASKSSSSPPPLLLSAFSVSS